MIAVAVHVSLKGDGGGSGQGGLTCDLLISLVGEAAVGFLCHLRGLLLWIFYQGLVMDIDIRQGHGNRHGQYT